MAGWWLVGDKIKDPPGLMIDRVREGQVERANYSNIDIAGKEL